MRPQLPPSPRTHESIRLAGPTCRRERSFPVWELSICVFQPRCWHHTLAIAKFSATQSNQYVSLGQGVVCLDRPRGPAGFGDGGQTISSHKNMSACSFSGTASLMARWLLPQVDQCWQSRRGFIEHKPPPPSPPQGHLRLQCFEILRTHCPLHAPPHLGRIACVFLHTCQHNLTTEDSNVIPFPQFPCNMGGES